MNNEMEKEEVKIELPRYRTAQQLLPTEQLANEEAAVGGVDIYLVFVQPC